MKYPLAAAALIACGGPGAGTDAPAGATDGPVTPWDGGGEPPGFWDTSNIPPAQHVMTFKFLNRTNGKFPDSAVYWSFQSGSIDELHSIAEQPTYDMPANASGRMYFYLCAPGEPTHCTEPRKSKYFDFLEHTIGAAQYNGNTTRVDAFGLKLAMRLRCADGFEATVGEDYATFAQSREQTFADFLASVPPAFQPLAQPPNGPYRIVEPGAGGFNTGGASAGYYDSFVDALWSANGITIAKPGPNGDGLGALPDLEAAIFRHTGAVAGSFHADGSIADPHLFDDAATFYTAAPADYYARFWHQRGHRGKAYGFPYDDAGGYSTYVSHEDPQYMLVAIGW
jgi:Beta-1,3-glucanase